MRYLTADVRTTMMTMGMCMCGMCMLCCEKISDALSIERTQLDVL